jgi:hypothetical protein
VATLEDLAARQPFARPPAVPAWTLGCFRRRCITYATGAEDTATQVIWIQSHGLTGDIRIPPGRPDVRHRSGLGDCTAAELAALARSEGGVAQTAWSDGRMRWDNWAAFQPYDKWPEPGELRRAGASLIEFAPSGIYVEDWRMQPGAGGLLAGLRLTHEAGADGRRSPRDGGLVIAGEHAIFALARRRPLPDDGPAQDQIAAAADPRALAEAAFDAEASYARAGRIILSTNPFREGEALALDGFSPGPEPDVLVQRVGALERWWRIDTLLDGHEAAFATPAEPAALAWLEREAATLLGGG